MGGLLQFIGDWGHLLAAGLFAVLAIGISRRFATQIAGKLLVAALSLTSIWLFSIAFGGVDRLETGVMESLRNCGWLVCLFILPGQFGQVLSRKARGALPLYIVLALLLAAQSTLDILASLVPSNGAAASAISDGAVLLRLLWAIGALLLVQRIYTACSRPVRAVVAPVAAALAAMWSYDLVLYGCALLGDQYALARFYALRGGMMALLVPVIALVGRTGHKAVVRPSRTLTWGVLSIAFGFVAALLVLSAVLAIDAVTSPLWRAIATAVLFFVIATGLLGAPATRLRRAARVLVFKHLFRHRYDYRVQWMAFVDTISGDRGGGQATLDTHQRLVKAMADITGSSAGSLLIPTGDGDFLWHSAWNWNHDHPDMLSFDLALVERMRAGSWVLDMAAARSEQKPGVPEWLIAEQAVWALVPLIHFDELMGVVLLSRPPVMRPLDWEDFDMLRAAGRQVASYIAEARGQQALDQARRFDEFNRRFAFIMHDVKNLVSQIGLVARNAERHADNPAFREDMILTLKDSTDKMNRLIARLSGQGKTVEAGVSRFAIRDAIDAVKSARGAAGQLLVEGDLNRTLDADRARVEQILGHLVQNAMEASGGAAPVIIRAEGNDRETRVSVIDHGRGMSAEFIRNELFRPFASTKEGGFGLGAFEARELARAMGGVLEVESAPGKGSCFTLCLPIAGALRPSSTITAERAAS